jgi:hypothetical protein
MTGPKAIQTSYAGCRFRSRLEARWAVALDQLGITWQYEAQGFHLPSGNYLPDFKVDGAAGPFFIEVKGPMPNAREFQVASEINLHVGPLIILQGDLPRRGGDGTAWMFVAAEQPDTYDWIMTDPEKALIYGSYQEHVDKAPARLPGWDAAVTAGRSARFEHGESG